jgi:hypothetical protein
MDMLIRGVDRFLPQEIADFHAISAPPSIACWRGRQDIMQTEAKGGAVPISAPFTRS